MAYFESSCLTLCAVRVFQFLIRWASSRMIKSGCQLADGVQVAVDHVVVGDLVERLGSRYSSRAARQRALRRPVASRPVNFSISLLPLVLERGGRDDQHAFDAGRAGEDFRGGDGLDRLAQAHVVGDQAAARLGREQRPFALIRIELGTSRAS